VISNNQGNDYKKEKYFNEVYTISLLVKDVVLKLVLSILSIQRKIMDKNILSEN
jgi:hypothetical protein